MRRRLSARNQRISDMQSIRSSSNEKIKKLVALSSKASLRKEEGVFVAEGTKLVMEAPASWIREIYISESCYEKMGEEFSHFFSEDSFIMVPDNVFGKISTMKTPQGMLAVVRSPEYTEKDLRGECPLIMILEDIQDPGNVGTIFRTAEAAGVTGIVLSAKCADPLSPKVVRSTMGAIFRVPYIITDDIPGFVAKTESTGVTCFAARLDASEEYDKCDFRVPTALLIGNEGTGLSGEASEAASKGVFIPMSGKTESLNAAISASILAYEARRQRNAL